MKQENNQVSSLLTVGDAAEILRTNKNFVYDLISSGQLKAMKLGSYKIRPQSLEAFIEYFEEVSNSGDAVEQQAGCAWDS